LDLKEQRFEASDAKSVDMMEMLLWARVQGITVYIYSLSTNFPHFSLSLSLFTHSLLSRIFKNNMNTDQCSSSQTHIPAAAVAPTTTHHRIGKLLYPKNSKSNLEFTQINLKSLICHF
jgi:hypothetical protein